MSIIEKPIDFLEGFGVNPGWLLLPLGIIMTFIVFAVLDLSSSNTFGYILKTAPLWLPVITFMLFFDYWLLMVRKKFDLEQGRVTLEIKIPQEVFKSPEAMELVLIQLYQTASPDNHLQTYLDGKHPPMYGLEIVSRGGDVRFYMNVPRRKFKNMAEMHLYAQYPGIEVSELPIDYTAEIPWDPDRFEYFSIHFNLKQDDALPIKTYYEFGLHTMPKEEEKIDPITTMLDMLGNIGPGEYYWVQILIDVNRKENFKVGSLFTVPDWKDGARKKIKEILNTAAERSTSEERTMSMMQLTDTEKETIKAIERSLGKNAFNVRIRAMYNAKKEAYLPGERIGPLITAWKAYDDLNRNQIGFVWRTDFDWNIWQDPSGKRRMAMKKSELDEYKRRDYTKRTPKDDPHVMTTEELATIYHLPGKVALTPTLGRIPSTRREAPSNLPT